MNTSDRQASEARGRAAESYAAAWLRLRGYKILDRRFKTRDGEIDIIARKGTALAFIEVKQRSAAKDAVEAVTYTSERRIMEAAQIYIEARPELFETDFEIRFDILYVIGRTKIRHEVDAFRAYD